MYPNNMMINPIMPIGIPQMVPAQPFSIKIDITPNVDYQNKANETQAAPQKNSVDGEKHTSIYDMPKTSIYEAKKATDVQAEKKIEDKKQETTMAQALAAQAAIQPTPVAQVKVTEVAKKPEIIAPDPLKPGIDLNGLISILTSPDYEEQADAMEAISEVTMYAPERAGELLDNKVVDNLLGIMNKDTSKLQGQEKQLAERNKEYAMYTTATLQKLYSDEIKAVANKTVPPEELIGMAGIVNELKTNPNASVREAAVASLGYINKPEYSKTIAPLIKEATNDKDARVQAQANKQLANA